MNQLIRFLHEYYELSSTDLNEMILQITRMINEETKLIQIIKYLESRLAFPSFEFSEELAKKITDVHNSTRQWVLKGHTPNEVFQEDRKHLRPLPKEPFKSTQEDSTINKPTISKNKVGRNDPCPCGSGQKFKKCCGK
ncbi:MAG: SEC-C domain-containing protein [Eubacteriaceae bacterium]|nr:SEC-C domain-containing protein [Eubacteriaceae bacterium]